MTNNEFIKLLKEVTAEIPAIEKVDYGDKGKPANGVVYMDYNYTPGDFKVPANRLCTMLNESFKMPFLEEEFEVIEVLLPMGNYDVEAVSALALPILDASSKFPGASAKWNPNADDGKFNLSIFSNVRLYKGVSTFDIKKELSHVFRSVIGLVYMIYYEMWWRKLHSLVPLDIFIKQQRKNMNIIRELLGCKPYEFENEEVDKDEDLSLKPANVGSDDIG